MERRVAAANEGANHGTLSLGPEESSKAFCRCCTRMATADPCRAGMRWQAKPAASSQILSRLIFTKAEAKSSGDAPSCTAPRSAENSAACDHSESSQLK